MLLFVHSYLFKSRQASSPSMFRFKVVSLHSGSIDSLQMSSQNQNEPNRSSLLFLLYLFWPERAFLIGYLPSLYKPRKHCPPSLFIYVFSMHVLFCSRLAGRACHIFVSVLHLTHLYCFWKWKIKFMWEIKDNLCVEQNESISSEKINYYTYFIWPERSPCRALTKWGEFEITAAGLWS